MKGKIYFDNDFIFADGEHGKKLIIILNDPQISSNEPYLVIRVTSDKPQRYSKAKPHCNSDIDIYFIPKSLKEFFDSDTYVQLSPIFEYTALEFLCKGTQKKLQEKGNLSTHIFNSIMNCIKKSDDISDKHYKMLFKKK